MYRPDSGSLLDAWERGLTQPPQRRLLTVLSAFMPERSPAEIAAMPVGRRDAALLEIYEQMFGTSLAAAAACPGCGEELEAEIAVANLRVRAPRAAASTYTLSTTGHRLSFRLPTTDDLLAIPPQSSPLDARRMLLHRCVLEAKGPDGMAVDPADMPERLTRALAARMAKLDPHASISLSLNCPACHRTFDGLLDVALFVLRQLHAWAQRMLLETHSLASAYGWSEAQILALSPARRQLYLEMVAP